MHLHVNFPLLSLSLCCGGGPVLSHPFGKFSSSPPLLTGRGEDGGICRRRRRRCCFSRAFNVDPVDVVYIRAISSGLNWTIRAPYPAVRFSYKHSMCRLVLTPSVCNQHLIRHRREQCRIGRQEVAAQQHPSCPFTSFSVSLWDPPDWISTTLLRFGSRDNQLNQRRRRGKKIVNLRRLVEFYVSAVKMQISRWDTV